MEVAVEIELRFWNYTFTGGWVSEFGNKANSASIEIEIEVDLSWGWDWQNFTIGSPWKVTDRDELKVRINKVF